MSAPACPACRGSGLVCPDAFGVWESWAEYLSRMIALTLREGYTEESSATFAGLVRPIPCPRCVEGPDAPRGE